MPRLGPLRRLFQHLLTSVRDAPVSGEERTRLQHFTVFVTLGIPTLIAYGIYHVVKADYPMAVLIWSSALGLAVGWEVLRQVGRGASVYRINAVLYGGLVLYMTAHGGPDGSLILWMYTVPLIAFFLLGRVEGLFWSAGAFAVALFFVGPFEHAGTFDYPASFVVRFAISYLIVSAVAYWFEFFRYRYRIGMEEEQRKKEEVIGQLQAALDQVRTLTGLIPLCAQCHRVRDTDGGWNRLEAYIKQHSNATVSHGLCPDCARELYPDLVGHPTDGRR